MISNKKYKLSTCSTSINDINIEERWSKTLNGEEFILHNSKHPIFGTLTLLNNYQKAIIVIYFSMERLNHAQIYSINYIQFIR